MKIFGVSIRTKPVREPDSNNRNGLAPLEMVLVLPLLMMVMAIIIVFGYASSWKLRSETVARDGVWRDRWHRFSNRNARAVEWPAPAITSVRSGTSIQSFDAEPVLDDPMIAGPIPNVNVNANLLDLSRGVRVGISDIDREPPIFASLTSIRYRDEHPILDNRFQIRQMGTSNWRRRMPLIWEIDLDFIRDSAAIMSAVAAIDNAPFAAQLVVLDRDEEFLAWYGTAPDFHPRARRFCNTDRGWVGSVIVPRLLRSIDNVPQRMARAFIRLYSDQLNAQPPPPFSTQQELQRRIDALRVWLDSL